MDRDSKRARIRAARDWLGQADASLDRKEDVQGDLKLMLAKAELEGAAPGKKTRRLKCWLSRGAALALAVLIALFIESWSLDREPVQEPAPMEAVPGVVADAAEADSGAAVPEAVGEQLARPQEEGENISLVQQPAAAQEETASSEGPFEAGSPQSAASPHLTYVPPRVPEPDKQRLMQEAGAVLRH